jgi:DNA-binding MarR family transcriptional regulator
MSYPKPERTNKASAQSVRWLDDDQQTSWHAVASMTANLRWALECQLERDADLSFNEYHTLARLSEGPDHTLRMSDLAVVTDASLSRLSHLMKRLEGRGLVRRQADPKDGRFTNAILTDAGYAKLVASAPAHVEAVRSFFVDELSAAELAEMREVSERVVVRIESTSGSPRQSTP